MVFKFNFYTFIRLLLVLIVFLVLFSLDSFMLSIFLLDFFLFSDRNIGSCAESLLIWQMFYPFAKSTLFSKLLSKSLLKIKWIVTNEQPVNAVFILLSYKNSVTRFSEFFKESHLVCFLSLSLMNYIFLDFDDSVSLSMFTFASLKLKTTLFRPRFIQRRNLTNLEIQEITKNKAELVKVIDKGTGVNKPFGHPGCIVSKSSGQVNVFTHSAMIPLNNGTMQKGFFASMIDLMLNKRYQYVTFAQKLISRPLNATELSNVNFVPAKRCIGLSILMKHYPNALQTLDKCFCMITPLNISTKHKYILMQHLVDTLIEKIWQK